MFSDLFCPGYIVFENTAGDIYQTVGGGIRIVIVVAIQGTLRHSAGKGRGRIKEVPGRSRARVEGGAGNIGRFVFRATEFAKTTVHNAQQTIGRGRLYWRSNILWAKGPSN